MKTVNRAELINKFAEIHKDAEQLSFITNESEKLVVSASAGCGKTRTMISKIAYEILSGNLPNNKKILALSFSVNAASKIREDLEQQLPLMLESHEISIDKYLAVSTYHGFATNIIKKHGYILHSNLKNIQEFRRFGDSSTDLANFLTNTEWQKLKAFEKAIQLLKYSECRDFVAEYLKIVLEVLVPQNVITYSGLLVIANQILNTTEIKQFYSRYYYMVIIDEAQDTNWLAGQLIIKLTDVKRMILLGDGLQKIYGFLGAIPNFLTAFKEKFYAEYIEFSTNYRFSQNQQMLDLDRYLRQLTKSYDAIEDFSEVANLKYKLLSSEDIELKSTLNLIDEKVSQGNTVALLFRSKWLADSIKLYFEKNSIVYFNGLFDDTDIEYLQFHSVALDIFINESGSNRTVRRSTVELVLSKITQKQLDEHFMNDEVCYKSLFRLLTELFKITIASKIGTDEKYDSIVYTLESNSLKRLMNEIEESITLTTIHGSKGLEWDYVIISGMYSFSFPSSLAVCRKCKNNKGGTQYSEQCSYNFGDSCKKEFLEELSLFYVAVTRAKKDVYCFVNRDKNKYGYTKRDGCFLSLPNLTLVDF